MFLCSFPARPSPHSSTFPVRRHSVDAGRSFRFNSSPTSPTFPLLIFLIRKKSIQRRIALHLFNKMSLWCNGGVPGVVTGLGVAPNSSEAWVRFPPPPWSPRPGVRIPPLPTFKTLLFANLRPHSHCQSPNEYWLEMVTTVLWESHRFSILQNNSIV